MATFTSGFETTYKDDFVDSDNYHRILFNSGRASKSKELFQRVRFGMTFQDGAGQF